MTECAWWQQHEVLRGEVDNAIHSFYTWKSINNYAAANPGVLLQMNRSPGFWNITTGPSRS